MQDQNFANGKTNERSFGNPTPGPGIIDIRPVVLNTISWEYIAIILLISHSNFFNHQKNAFDICRLQHVGILFRF